MLFIVIPAYNEEQNIAHTIADCLTVAKKENIIVVDDGSQDKTYDIASGCGVNIVRHLLNRGQGAALTTGTRFALKHGADIIVHFDGDGQFEAKDIVSALNILQSSSTDVVLGSRFLGLVNKSIPIFKKIMLKTAARWVNFIFTDVWLSDAHNGFRVMTALAAQKIDITQDRMAHNSEIIRQLKKNNLRFVEMPVKVHYKEYGQGFSGGLKIIREWLMAYLTKV
jgi:glycosyltransferase involved in cell wall biosynthesis